MAVSNLPLVGRWTSGRVNGGWRLVIGESGTRETTRESYSGRQRPDDWVPHAIATPYVLVALLFSQHRTELAISRASSRASACNSTESNAAAESDKVSVSRVALTPTKLNLPMRVNHEAMLVAG
jgi:hypothetical protein